MNRCSIHSVNTGLSVWAGFLLTCCAIVRATPELDKSDPATGYYPLQTRIILNQRQSPEQSASQYPESIQYPPSETRDFLLLAGKENPYVSVFVKSPYHCSLMDDWDSHFYPKIAIHTIFLTQSCC